MCQALNFFKKIYLERDLFIKKIYLEREASEGGEGQNLKQPPLPPVRSPGGGEVERGCWM